LDKTAQGILKKISQKYDDLAQVDKLAAVASKVESVKLVMQENVDLALQNFVKLESIEKTSEEEWLPRHHSVVKRNANELEMEVWWNNVKVTYLDMYTS
jgi:hypothetical protein